MLQDNLIDFIAIEVAACIVFADKFSNNRISK